MILIVDDNAEILDIVRERLEMSGHAVLQASGAEQALQLVAARPEVALMVTDIRMAGMSGLELAEAAVARRPDLRVILISGYFHPQTLNMRFLQKPFTFAELDAAIRAELGR
jgi:DNA-binding NtrC family response regulator